MENAATLKLCKFASLAALVVVHASALAQQPAAAPAAPSPNATEDARPIVHVPAFAYPASELVSEELRQAYAKSIAGPGNGTIPIPDNPQVVTMMRTVVNSMLEKSLPWVRGRYPVETTSDRIGGVEVIRVKPRAGISRQNRKRVLISVHGGSFMVGWPSAALLDSIPVASLSGVEVITIHYRLYPEAVHPAGLEDLANVYRELLKTHKASDIGIYGGSAGGVIVLQSIPWFKRHGLPRPGAIAALSAAFRTAIGDSAIWNFSGGFAAPGTRLIEIGGYMGHRDRRDWALETGPDELGSYPPTLWLTGNRAPEVSGVTTAHAQMLAKGVDSQLYLIEGGWHQSYSTAPMAPESQDAMRYVARWFDDHLRK